MSRHAYIPYTDIGVLESPEAVLSTMTRDGRRRWMYPEPAPGRFQRARLVLGWSLIALFVALPIVRINGRPAVLLDVMRAEFSLFGATFFPTDTFLLLLLGVGSILGIILFTALLGRVWCGWACPQTVYMEFVYRPVERWIEGKEHVRKRRDEGPWTIDKIWRKGAKHAVYLLISLALAHVFVAYFAGWERLLEAVQAPPAEHWGYFVTMALTTGLVLFNFGYFREQMCTIACPYARFQSVMLDPDSLIVSYDSSRGEPRAKRSVKKLREEEQGMAPLQGDCIDCLACVRTCPTGIDIRDGLQMECIACTQCIDACDAIMDRIEKPRGLIRYTSEHALEGKRPRVARPRTVIYAGLFILLASAFTYVVAARSDYDVNVGRIAGEPYMELPDGQAANRLRFRVRNQTPTATTFRIDVERPYGARVRIVGTQPVPLAPQEMTRIEAWIVVPPGEFEAGRTEGEFRLRFEDGTVVEKKFTLLGPY